MSAPPTTLMPKLVPTSAASKHTGLPVYRIRALTVQGMPCVRIGSKLYFDLAEVDAWIDKNLVSVAGAGTPHRPTAPPPDPDWVTEQVAKFSPHDLRRAGELLLALSTTPAPAPATPAN